jgi:hypothetical protein
MKHFALPQLGKKPSLFARLLWVRGDWSVLFIGVIGIGMLLF